MSEELKFKAARGLFGQFWIKLDKRVRSKYMLFYLRGSSAAHRDRLHLSGIRRALWDICRGGPMDMVSYFALLLGWLV